MEELLNLPLTQATKIKTYLYYIYFFNRQKSKKDLN